MFGEHLKDMRMLMDLKRYQTRFRHKQRSVAEHSWFVSKVAMGLAYWENNKFKRITLDTEWLMFLAINHDIVEAYTGDIISSTKNMSPNLKAELSKVEEIIINSSVLPTIPNSWGPDYTKMQRELSSHSTNESKLVKCADLIDRLFECKEEMDLGNSVPFQDIINNDLKTLHTYAHQFHSVAYFLKYSAHDIGVHAYYTPELSSYLESIDFSEYF